MRWIVKKLSEITDVRDGTHDSPKQKPMGKKLVTSKHLINGKVNHESAYFISEEDFEKINQRSKVDQWDLLFAMIGTGTVGQLALISESSPDYAIKNVGLIKTKDKNLAKWLYFYLQSPQAKNAIDGLISGSSQPYISLGSLRALDIEIPPLPEQKAIASVLSSLDDKIDLLHRQNKTLEAMAETLFRQWFIEEASEDWEEVPLSEVAVIQNGYAFSSRDYVEKTTDEYEVLKMGHIDKNSTLKLNPKRDYVPRKPELKKFVLNYNDIVMPMTDMKDNVVILGVPALVDASDKYVLNQRVARIYLKEDSKLSSTYYLFLQLKDPDFIARLQSTANSGVQVNLSTQAIKDCPIVIPSVEKQAEHKKDIANFYDRLSNNRKKIQTLEKLRDTLLPKLMSGEVRIQYQTEEVA